MKLIWKTKLGLDGPARQLIVDGSLILALSKGIEVLSADTGAQLYCSGKMSNAASSIARLGSDFIVRFGSDLYKFEKDPFSLVRIPIDLIRHETFKCVEIRNARDCSQLIIFFRPSASENPWRIESYSDSFELEWGKDYHQYAYYYYDFNFDQNSIFWHTKDAILNVIDLQSGEIIQSKQLIDRTAVKIYVGCKFIYSTEKVLTVFDKKYMEKIAEHPLKIPSNSPLLMTEDEVCFECGGTVNSYSSDGRTHYFTTELPKEAGWNSAQQAPIIYNGKLLLGTNSGYLWILDKKNGRILDRFKTDDYCHQQPIISQGKVYTASVDGAVYCLELE